MVGPRRTRKVSSVAASVQSTSVMESDLGFSQISSKQTLSRALQIPDVIDTRVFPNPTCARPEWGNTLPQTRASDYSLDMRGQVFQTRPNEPQQP